MGLASEFLTGEEQEKVEAAIAEAERKTTGEIVVVIASRSGRYDRGEGLCGVVLGLVVLSLGWLLWQGVSRAGNGWDAGWVPTLGLPAVLALFVVGYWAGTALARRFPLLARMFVPTSLMLAEIQDKAAMAFHRFRVRRTAAATGVLIYLSLFERLLWVVADDAVSEEVPPEVWDEIRDAMIVAIAKDRAAEGLVEAVRRCGEVLAEHLPADEDNPNELTNEVFLLD